MSDDDADRLAAVAVELVQRVRDEDPAANGRWLANTLTSADDWFRLCFVLAAAVPDDRSWRALTAWAVQDRRRELQPHGTPAAARRHQYRGEEMCEPCRDAERARDRARKKSAYWAAKGAA